MSDKPSDELLAAIEDDASSEKPNEATLAEIRDVMRKARIKEMEIAACNERLAMLKAEHDEIFKKQLPDLFVTLKIKAFTLDAEGNMPPFTLKLNTHYFANIKADWPEEQRERAFTYLEKVQKVPDLIRTVITIDMPRGERKAAKQVEAALRKLKVPFNSEKTVPWSTLTAWLREMCEKHNEIPDLQIIGASVAQVVAVSRDRKRRNASPMTMEG